MYVCAGAGGRIWKGFASVDIWSKLGCGLSEFEYASELP